MKKWVVYVVECADGSLYTGITNNLPQRLVAHDAGRGAKYTKPRRPVQLRHAEYRRTKGAALKREAAIKALTRAEKLALIAQKV
ncbi:MAG: GIY-YIG nuclease family protein [Nitrospiraceae bacterium]|nr:GIY-YIG nuclease family protein [Nitrospiraceae bacterium]